MKAKALSRKDIIQKVKIVEIPITLHVSILSLSVQNPYWIRSAVSAWSGRSPWWQICHGETVKSTLDDLATNLETYEDPDKGSRTAAQDLQDGGQFQDQGRFFYALFAVQRNRSTLQGVRLPLLSGKTILVTFFDVIFVKASLRMYLPSWTHISPVDALMRYIISSFEVIDPLGSFRSQQWRLITPDENVNTTRS